MKVRILQIRFDFLLFSVQKMIGVSRGVFRALIRVNVARKIGARNV